MHVGFECEHASLWRNEIERRDREIARLRAELRRRAPAPPSSDDRLDVELTEREREVLDLIAVGASTQEIAEALFLGVNSVKTHTQSLFRKLGVTTRTQAALWAVRRGSPSRSRTDGATAPDRGRLTSR